MADTTALAQLQSGLAAVNASLGQLRESEAGTLLYNIKGSGDVNTGYTLQSAYLVFFMQAGFAMLSAGSVRAKNAKNIILLNLLDACFGCIAWYATGFAFAFGGDPPPGTPATSGGNPFIGSANFFQSGLPRTSYSFWFFQFTFAATSATIVSGAVAERCKFECYVAYNLMLVSFVYPVVAHWVWSPSGWVSALRTSATATSGYTLLFNSGVYDFAGDGPVHMVGGFASLVAARVLGPRIGRFDAAGSPVDMPGHSASLTLLGVFLLWFGWYGFNPGSTNAVLGPFLGYSSISAAIAVNTTISAAAATISTLLVSMLHQYLTLGVVVWDLIIAGNGALAGLVAITGGCAFLDTWAAMITGFVAGGVYYGASKLVLHRFQIDDPLDAIAVHAGGAVWGMLACAAFASPNMVADWYGPHPVDGGQRPYGFIMGGGGNLLAAHLIYILAIFAWVVGLMGPFFMLLHKLKLMRVTVDVEALGLDISYHGGSSYPGNPEPAMTTMTAGGAAFMGSEAYMTRDEVERLLEASLLSMEKRTEQRAALALLHAGATPAHLPVPPGDVELANLAAEGTRGAAPRAPHLVRALADGGQTGGADAADPGGGSSADLPRIKSLGGMQQAMQRAYQDQGGEGSDEGTRHSHVSWADDAPPKQ